MPTKKRAEAPITKVQAQAMKDTADAIDDLCEELDEKIDEALDGVLEKYRRASLRRGGHPATDPYECIRLTILRERSALLNAVSSLREGVDEIASFLEKRGL